MKHQTQSHASSLRHDGTEFHLFRAVMRIHQAILNNFSRSAGISISQFMLLRLIATAEQRVGIMDLARQMGINASAVTRLVNELEQDGIVRREPDPKDGRRSYITLSDMGIKRAGEVHDRCHQVERAFSSAISPDEMGKLVDILERLENFIASQARG